MVCLNTPRVLSFHRSKHESFQQLSMAVDGGINFFDTAEMYPVPQRAATQVRTAHLSSRRSKHLMRQGSCYTVPGRHFTSSLARFSYPLTLPLASSTLLSSLPPISALHALTGRVGGHTRRVVAYERPSKGQSGHCDQGEGGGGREGGRAVGTYSTSVRV